MQRFLHGEITRCVTVAWTDQMRHFLWEILQNNVKKNPFIRSKQRLSLPSPNPEQELGLLGGILTYALQGLTTRDLEGGSISAKTVLMLFDWLLDREETNELKVSLWAPGPRGRALLGPWVFSAQLERGLAYSDGTRLVR